MVWARSSWHMMMAPRGPRSVLWVVVVMTCASPAGYLVTGQELRLSVDAVVDEAIQLAREVDVEPVGQMATLGQVHAHGHIARLHEGGVGGPVGLGGAGVVLRGDELNTLAVPLLLAMDNGRHLWVPLVENAHVLSSWECWLKSIRPPCPRSTPLPSRRSRSCSRQACSMRAMSPPDTAECPPRTTGMAARAAPSVSSRRKGSSTSSWHPRSERKRSARLGRRPRCAGMTR